MTIPEVQKYKISTSIDGQSYLVAYLETKTRRTGFWSWFPVFAYHTERLGTFNSKEAAKKAMRADIRQRIPDSIVNIKEFTPTGGYLFKCW